MCSGNTCRSPMAEALFREKVKASAIEIRPAGTSAFNGDLVLSHALSVLKERAIDYSGTLQGLNWNSAGLRGKLLGKTWIGGFSPNPHWGTSAYLETPRTRGDRSRRGLLVLLFMLVPSALISGQSIGQTWC